VIITYPGATTDFFEIVYPLFCANVLDGLSGEWNIYCLPLVSSSMFAYLTSKLCLGREGTNGCFLNQHLRWRYKQFFLNQLPTLEIQIFVF